MPSMAIFVPHPDDEAYAFAGLMALAARGRWDISVHCATSGEGGNPRGRTRAHLARQREQELTDSCLLLGSRPPEFWRLADGRLWGRPPETARIQPVFDSRPDIILTLGADGVYGHADHLALHSWVRDAWSVLDRDRPALLLAAFPRGLFVPQYERCLPGYTLRRPSRLPGRLRRIHRPPPLVEPEQLGTVAPTYAVDIRRVREQKLAAIACHKSQLDGGDPFALFPAGIVGRLLAAETLVDATGRRSEKTLSLLTGLALSASAG